MPNKGEELVVNLQRNSAEERFRACATDVQATLAGIIDAIIAPEHAPQRHDALLLRELKLPANMVPGKGWPLLISPSKVVDASHETAATYRAPSSYGDSP